MHFRCWLLRHLIWAHSKPNYRSTIKFILSTSLTLWRRRQWPLAFILFHRNIVFSNILLINIWVFVPSETLDWILRYLLLIIARVNGPDIPLVLWFTTRWLLIHLVLTQSYLLALENFIHFQFPIQVLTRWLMLPLTADPP